MILAIVGRATSPENRSLSLGIATAAGMAIHRTNVPTKDATVSICHIKTRDLAQYTILADILIVAAGCPGLITAPMVKRGAVVIDVGINRLPDGKLAGDVDFEGVRAKASFITPVPGGVGPMTVTMLICNTVAAAERNSAKNVEKAPVPA